MKTAKHIDNAKLGIFVFAGLIFLILMLYLIGKNRNLIGPTFTIKAVMSNVNGLVTGNNVRFKGIDVGTVKSIHIESDSTILVTLIIDKKVKPFIKQNAIASVGTDGLMGNKLININSQPGSYPAVKEGDLIQSVHPVETDQMLRTLNTTNDNIARISGNLFEITEKLNSSNSLWSILSDTVIASDLKGAVSEFRMAGASVSDFSARADRIVTTFETGDGIAHRLFTDTTLSRELSLTVNQLNETMYSTSAMMRDLRRVIDEMRAGSGTAGLILTDTVFRDRLYRSAGNIEQGTGNFNQNMEALKRNFLFRRYFRKLEKQQQSQEHTQTRKEP